MINLFEKLYTPKGLAVVLVLGVAVNISLFWFTHPSATEVPRRKLEADNAPRSILPRGFPRGNPRLLLQGPRRAAKASGRRRMGRGAVRPRTPLNRHLPWR